MVVAKHYDREYSDIYISTNLDRTIGDQTRKIRSTMEIAKSTFIIMEYLSTNRDITMVLRMVMLRCYVYTALLYRVQAPLNKNHIDQLRAFEMWYYRRMWCILWTERITSVEEQNRVQKKCESLTSK